MHSTIESIAPIFQTAIPEFWGEHKQDSSFMESLQFVIRACPALQFGDCHWRTISENGTDFMLPEDAENLPAHVIAWSRILDGKELLCAVNLHRQQQCVVYVTIDYDLQVSNSKLNRLFGPDNTPTELNVEDRNGKCVRLTIPPDSLVIYG
ncbi:alpha amylase C-terminal domain-containing protein [Dyadobacter aurulentus]|uniref:alpha amylase C-terminal domain-containing protein n=1 Tax=Dyadobacter sp. UC 10 TaxID=2605428 RepID=UPI0011F1F8C0|nr:alpha amylase C-terminal domain-containing protein [Dyadobacter sp. UC 10]KAA0992125.1 hypothetical protein FXO21_19050 [Dyadobacter sp. UC 10]